MYLSLGASVILPYGEIVGIFDLDNTTQSHRTRAFLERAERDGLVTAVGEDLPKSFVLWQGKDGRSGICLTRLSSATLRGRAKNSSSFVINLEGE